MKNNLLRTTIAAAAVAMLSACGGGGGSGGSSDIGSNIVKVSFDGPQGTLEAGRLVTITGRAVSQNGKLDKMNWTLSGAGEAGATASITNADCKDVTKSDSSFGAGSSNWSCVATLLTPKTLSEATTYELGLSASGAAFGGKGTTRVTIKPAAPEINPVQVQFGPLPTVVRAGEAVNINGVITSSASKLTGARWTVVNSGSSQNSAFPVPTLDNADCAIRTENTNPTGRESSTWNCAVRMIVSPRLNTAADYKLTLVGTNANGFSLSNSLSVPVSAASATANKVSVTLNPVPAGVKTGDKITISGSIKSTGSTLDTTKSGFSVVNVTPINGLTGPQDYTIASKCLEVKNPTGTTTSEIACTGNLTVPSTVTMPVTLTYALSGVDDEGFGNFATKDLTVQPRSDAFGARSDVAYSPKPVVPGSTVNLTCQAQGNAAGYTYSWRVANSGGTSINLSSTTTTTGNSSFIAPTPLTNTDVIVECGVSDGTAVTYTPLTVTIPGSTSPLGFRADVNATPNPAKPGDTVALTCQGQGVANANYTYAWKIVNASGTTLRQINASGPNSGAASFVAPAIPTGNGPTPSSTTVTLACSVSDGVRVIESPIDVIINEPARNDAFGSRANVAYAPVPVVPGAPVNLTCAAQGGGTYTYSWRVANANGTLVNVNSSSTTTGNSSFLAPTPLVNTNVVVECGVFDGTTVTYTPLIVPIPGATSPLGFRADVNATPNPVQPGNPVNLTCQGQGVNNATYTYGWRVTNSNGTGLNTVTSAGPSTGAASFVAPSIPPGSGPQPATSVIVSLACSVSDGTRVVTQPIDVIITQ